MESRFTQRIGAVLVLTTVLLPNAALSAQKNTVYCSHGGTVEHSAMRVSELSNSIPSLFPAAGYPELRVRVLEVLNYNTKRTEKLNRMIPLMERALNSEALRDFVLNHVYRGKKQFSDNEGLTNEQIYEKIREANEELFSNDKYVAEFSSDLYYTRKNVVGYVSPRWPEWINTNTKYFDYWSDAFMAAHLVHEWLHLIGFSHYQTFPYSVPYAVGDAVESIINSFPK